MVEGYRLNVVDRAISWRAVRFEVKSNRLQMIILEVAVEEFLNCHKGRKTGTIPPQVRGGWDTRVLKSGVKG